MSVRTLILAPLAATLLAACVNLQGRPDDAPAGKAAEESSKSKIPPGMNDKGEVVDSTKVEGGTGKKVVGLAETEGEIFGKPAPGSKLAKLQIGMTENAVMDVAGQPSDRGAYATGKGFIPFYMGSDRFRHEWVYKGQGRLVFTGGGGVGDMTGRLITIIHNRSEPAYR